VALLGALAALLVWDGEAPARPSAAPAQLASQRLDAAAVSQIVESANPALSPRELERIGMAVVRYSHKYDLDPELVTAVLLVESSARPGARSPKGALGLMQVMPHVIRPYRLAGHPSTIETNVEAGCLILADNIRRLGEEDGISAYFWGSEIRGEGYLLRVRAARNRVRSLLSS
jgi:soluble lytic murein transglycosylase-like protein